MAFETLEEMHADEPLPDDSDSKKRQKNYIKAVNKGMLKVMSKMGISTLQSYRGRADFRSGRIEPRGDREYFTWTASRIQGIGLRRSPQEVRMRHERAFPRPHRQTIDLDLGGQYQWRRNGEVPPVQPGDDRQAPAGHARTTIRSRTRSSPNWINEQKRQLCTLRGLLDFKFASEPIPIEEVEPWTPIVKRFKTGAMSFGSISKEAHETLAIAMNRIGGKSNTGEGGEDAGRFTAGSERRLAPQRDQAGGLRPFWRDQRNIW